MLKSFFRKRSVAARSSSAVSMIEALESRQLLSTVPTVVFKAVTPKKILAGGAGKQIVIVHNIMTTDETVDVVITPAPSADGVTAAGAYTSPSVTETLTIKKHHAAKVIVPFTASTTLNGGKYFTLDTAVLNGTTFTGTAPGTYLLVVPPTPTTTPSLLGHYSGLITQHTGGGGLHFTHQATFIWNVTDQTLTGLTGTFSVGSQSTTGTMVGSELANGTFQFSLTSDKINYVISGSVTPDGLELTGKFKGTLIDNIFPKLGGKFKIDQGT